VLPTGDSSTSRFGKERITIYELVDPPDDGTFTSTARPVFGFDFTALELYDVPGVISEPDPATSRGVRPLGRGAGASRTSA
jgi:hypothetical protein